METRVAKYRFEPHSSWRRRSNAEDEEFKDVVDPTAQGAAGQPALNFSNARAKEQIRPLTYPSCQFSQSTADKGQQGGAEVP